MNNKFAKKWEKKKLGNISKVINGYAFKVSDLTKSDLKFPIVRMNNLKSGYLDLSDALYIKTEIAKDLEKFKLHIDDFIFGMSGSLSNYAWVRVIDGICYQNQRVGRLKPINSDQKFISYLFISDQVQSKILLYAAGAAQLNISSRQIEELVVLVPPTIEEQKKIASILTSVDNLIEKTQLQINKLQDLKKGMINKLLIKGIGHTEFKDSELGIVPKSWKIMELSKVSKILSSNVDKKTKENETSVLLCNYMDVYKNLKITREINFMKASAKKSEIDKFLIKKDDVIITKDSETPDDIAISSYVSENFDNVLCGYHLSIIRPNKSVLDGKFLNFFFKLDYMHHRFSILANGTTRFGLNLKEVENSKILIPELEEQKKIANIICSVEDKISIIKKKLNKYVFIKKSLMQDLLTGKVRVSVN